jgi:hypothetical protein
LWLRLYPNATIHVLTGDCSLHIQYHHPRDSIGPFLIRKPSCVSRSLPFVALTSAALIAHMQRTNSMLFANFNQDFTCVPVSFLDLFTPYCFSQLCLRWYTQRLQHHKLRPFWPSIYYECVWSMPRSISWNFDTFELDDGARGIVEMLFCTSLIALVGAADQPSSSPRKLQIVNTKVRSRHPV